MQKTVIVIGAVSRNGVYGEGNKIPWHSKDDFKQFKEKTTGHTVVMGRGTWESLPPKFRPLPDRDNVVITNTPGYIPEGATVSRSIEQAVADAPTEKVFCIGGVSIWYHAMHFADEAWVSVLKKEYPISVGITHTAIELLAPYNTWPEFCLKETENYEEFILYHWVRK